MKVTKVSRVAGFGGVFFSVFLILICAGVVLAQADPLIGTWKLNIGQSRFDPEPGPKSQTIVYTKTPTGYKAVTQSVDAQDKSTKAEFTIVYDGKDHPIVGSPDFDAASYTKTDASRTDFSRKKGGKVVQTGTRTLSRDGTVLTIATKGTDAAGQQISSVATYFKQ